MSEGKNKNLTNAKKAKNDEFYTQYHDIEKEVNAYLDYNPDVFRDKTIFLPCDDPEWSNFTRFFAQNFERFGLKKLISTSYARESKEYQNDLQLSLLEVNSPKFDKSKTNSRGKIYTLTRDISGDGKVNIDDLNWDYLDWDGDFRNKEVTKLRDESDIIITNPPFSLFRDFLAWIVQADKKFAIIWNINAITYKETFPLIKENKLWLGATNFNTGMYFRVPEDFVYSDSYKFERVKNGEKINRVPGVCWFSNVDHGRRHQPIPLMTESDIIKFSTHKPFEKYDNYDAIEISLAKNIPSDYEGVMWVPITFLDKYSPEQFTILWATQRGCHDEVPDIRKYDDYWEVKPNGEKTGSSGGKTNENANLLWNDGKKNYFTNKEWRVIQSAYQRIFIKHKK
jgi:hypothetical protein